MVPFGLIASWSQIAQTRPFDKSISTRGFPTANAGRHACADEFQPKSFIFDNASYIRYEVPHGIDTQPNSTQFVFEVSNESNGILTGCSFYQVMVDEKYPDTFSHWNPCYDRSLNIDGYEVEVKTSARVDLDIWEVSVNQSWSCREG